LAPHKEKGLVKEAKANIRRYFDACVTNKKMIANEHPRFQNKLDRAPGREAHQSANVGNVS
jgi:hypothetical protein